MRTATLVATSALSATLLAAGLMPRARAFPPYLDAFKAHYPTSTLPERMSALAGAECYACHVPPTLGTEGTCYRLALRDLINQNFTIEQAIAMLDPVDSDNDGVPNGVEITTPRPEGGVGYHPGLIGATGTSPCGPDPAAPITGMNETPPIPCYANCDQSTTPPILNVADFGCFLTKFAAGDLYADCDGAGPPQLNVADFTCFLVKFAAGCS